jgi:ubiquinone/menaquinone biosynthesis C-methylase UbiE
MKQWYEELFENSAVSYDKEIYTQGTIGEVDFIEKEINFDKSKKILDIGCGTGRHAIELAKRGYDVTGIDYSEAQLKRAKEKAKNENVKITFLQADARKLSFNNQFDLALMLCEGAFPLMETDEMNFQILENASRALKQEGKLILTTLNALFPLFHSVKEFLNTHGMDSAGHSFDLMTFRDHSTLEMVDDSGVQKKIKCNERYYTPPEINWLLKSLQFKEVGIYGCDTGEFSRDKRLKTDDFEMLVVAEK